MGYGYKSHFKKHICPNPSEPMKRVICWLSRQRNGLYLLTQKKPILAKVGDTDEKDFYIPTGDGIGFRHMCEWSVKTLWGIELDLLESCKVWFAGGAINECFAGAKKRRRLMNGDGDGKRRQMIVGLAMLDGTDPPPRFVVGCYYSQMKTEGVIAIEALMDQPKVKDAWEKFMDAYGEAASDLGMKAAMMGGTDENVLREITNYKAAGREGSTPAQRQLAGVN